MDKAAVRKIIKDFQAALEARDIAVEKFILFGSFAEGRSHEGSDIDIIVVSPDFGDKSYWQRIEVMSEAIYEIFQPIEAVAMTPDEWERKDSLISQYASSGEVIQAA